MRRASSFALSRPATPFERLVMHFVKRMFASEEDQGPGAVSLGLGAVLAVVACPGGLASLFLLDKYSSTIQYFRGQTNFNPYKASVADEFFFVVLSMTITGLVMVLRWNRLLPDSRDFANLAVLPIPIRNVFVANFTALAGLAVVFGIDVNGVSALVFPAVVTANQVSLALWLRFVLAHSVAVFSASLFSFFAVFAAVGVLMAVLPRRLFRPVSIAARVVLVVALLCEFLWNLFLQLFSGRLPHLRENYMRYLPAYWFLGIYEHMVGLGNAARDRLAREAGMALVAVMVIAAAAYALCYRRHFLRLAESLELVGPARRRVRIQLPKLVERILFRSEFEHASMSFMWKVLLRSERHLMFMGGYLGIGLVLAAQSAADSMARSRNAGLPDSDWLLVPLVIALMLVTGLRFAFDLPAALSANWVFRIGTETPTPSPVAVARRFMLWTVLPWQLGILGSLTAYEFGWRVAGEHVATVIVLTMLLIEVALLGFRKIPFTCSTQLESRRLLFRIIWPLLGVLMIAPGLASLEHWMLERPPRFAAFAICAAVAFVVLRRFHQGGAVGEEDAVCFEEQSGTGLELLKLN